MTTFSVVIATRNRPEALERSLPLLLKQSRLPETIVVADASDDPGPNAGLVARLAAGTQVAMEHHVCPPGSAGQRNMGVTRVASDVVVFPDDDSLFHEGAMDAILRVYERDTRGAIAGVCGIEVGTSPLAGPPAGTPQEAPARRKSFRDRLRTRLSRRRTQLEERFAPDPLRMAGRRLMDRLPPPEDWLEAERAVRVEWMTGFRMSFRREVIARRGFDDRLGRYALYEDIDAGFEALGAGGALVAAREARIFHDKAPGRRAGGFEMGAVNILNRAYVVLKSGAPDDALRGAIRRYARFRTIQFHVVARGRYGRDRAAGARAALGALPELLAAPPGELGETYSRVRDACLAKAPGE